jgi:hypothetical protein
MTALGRAAPLLALALCVAGCHKGSKSGSAPSASVSAGVPPAPVASGLPGDPMATSRIVNPKGEAAYSGPSGGVRGIVTVTGDPAPTMNALLAKIPDSCAKAREAYAPLFREGMMRSLADVLVGVTGYKGYVPEREPRVMVEAKACSFNTRTLALTFGQILQVVSKDKDAYVPVLLGSQQPAQLMALPGGSGAELFPQHPGRFMLSDSIKIFMYADVLVLKYATHAVTGLDGRYQIDGIPVGEVKVNALLPSTGSGAEKTVKIEAGKLIDVNLEIPFDAKKHAEQSAAKSAPAGSAQGAGSAKPAPSVPAP